MNFKIFKKSLVVLFSLLFSLILISNTTIAQSIEVDYEFDLDLVSGPGSIGTLIVNFANTDPMRIVDRYKVTIPVENPQSISATLGGEPQNNIIVEDVGSFKSVTVNFDRPILKDETKELRISFTSPQLLRSSFGISQLFIRNPFDNLSKDILYKINYPKNFGSIFRTYSNQNIIEGQDRNTIEIVSNNGVYILWGNEIKVNISSEVNIKNEESSTNTFFYNLPSTSTTQKLLINSLVGIDKLYSDESENVFAIVDIQGGETKKLSYDISVRLNEVEEGLVDLPSYGFPFDENSSFGKEVIESTQNLQSPYDKLRIFNQILRNRVQPNKQSIIDYLNFNQNIWNRLDREITINSFEYAALVVSFAEYLGLSANLEYGYLISSPVDIDLSRPQVWAIVDIGERNIFIDTFSEDLSGISYFDIKYIDRVKFGTWHPLQSYNPATGLAYVKNPIKVLLSESQNEFKENDIQVELVFPDSIASGEFYSPVVKIKNNGDSPVVIKDLLINSESFIENIFSENGFVEIIMPKSTNEYTINFMREENIFYSGLKDFDVKVQFYNDGNEIGEVVQVNFFIDIRNIVIFAVIFTAITVGLWYLLVRIRRFVRKS